MNTLLLELNEFRSKINLCLDQCIQDGTTENLTADGEINYPCAMNCLEKATKILFQYLLVIEKTGQMPYFAGATSEFFWILDQLQDIATAVLSRRIPKRYHNSTGKNNTCYSRRTSEIRKREECEIRTFLSNLNANYHLNIKDEWITAEIDKEFKGWINKLYSIYSYLKDKRVVL